MHVLLPNAWDVMSTRLFEQAGSGAIATTSGGVLRERQKPGCSSSYNSQ